MLALRPPQAQAGLKQPSGAATACVCNALQRERASGPFQQAVLSKRNLSAQLAKEAGPGLQLLPGLTGQVNVVLASGAHSRVVNVLQGRGTQR